jgi:betaine reductase
MVGSYRIVPVSSIVHPLGDPELTPAAEKKMRRSVVEKALDTLKED